jgi:hypothetical protein
MAAHKPGGGGSQPVLPLDIAGTGAFTVSPDNDEAWGVTEDGYESLLARPIPADADIRTGEVLSWYDDTNGAAKFYRRGKTADGTVVQAVAAMRPDGYGASTFATVQRTATQSITDGTTITIGWADGIVSTGGATFTLDTDGGSGPTRLHVPEDGIYIMSLFVYFDPAKTIGFRSLAPAGGDYANGGVGTPWPATVNPDGYIWGTQQWAEFMTAGSYVKGFATAWGAGSAVDLVTALMVVAKTG